MKDINAKRKVLKVLKVRINPKSSKVKVKKMSVQITSLLASTLENMVKKAVREALKSCGTRYEIDVEAECRIQGVEDMKMLVKAMPKRSEGKSKVSKSKENIKKEVLVPLPFNKEVSESKCKALCYNKGLYTQCDGEIEGEEYCKQCDAEGAKWGTVAERLKVGINEYEGKCGRKPVAYLKVLEKLKISVEEAQEAASKQGVVIDEEHLLVGKTKKDAKSSRGRPKKEVQQVEAEAVVDLFAQISSEVEVEKEGEKEVEKEVEIKSSKKLSDEDRAAKKAALEAEKAKAKAQAKAEIEAKKAQAKAEIEAKKAEKEAEKAKAKAEMEAKKAQAKAEKPKAKKAEKSKEKPEEKVNPEAKKPEEPKKVTVTRIQIDGTEYMKSSANILYDPTTKEEVGLWDPETQTIKDLPEDDEEEEEEEYE